ncbi:hypothetical protein GOV03_04510 [Candidatus Woesearchaeota archaeon]|nr:hypothetical protein [Candidatus Woesearchaeota archaeon]
MFYDVKEEKCKIYSKRPLDCRTYPLMMWFDDKIIFGLDGDCPKIKEITPEDIEKTKQEWLNSKLPLSWIKAYTELE